MAYILIALSAFLIGFSGALMPGPLLGLTIDIGLKKGPFGGLFLALGHVILDFFILILLLLGLKDFMTRPIVAAIIGIVGGCILFYMGFDMFMQAYKNKVSMNSTHYESTNSKWGALMIKGATISISNPYYALWWSSIGLAMIISASSLGNLGIAMFYFGHIAADLIWLGFVGFAMYKSQKVMSQKVYKGIILGIGSFVAVFGIYFFVSGISFWV